MHAEFWQTRWSRNEIGFHLDEVNPYLQRHWPALGLAPQARVLVPLCGKSLDLGWLAAQGHAVVGVELSPKAVEDFFQEQHLQPQVEQRDGFQIYRAAGLEIFCGDVFALSVEHLGACDALFDRAALIALPPEMRVAYAAHLKRLLKPGTPGLLVSLDYDQAQMSGPPFSVPDEEVQALLAGHWRAETLEAGDVLGDNWRFQQRGLTRLEERVYRLGAV